MPVYGITCKNAKPKDRPYKPSDSEGLHLLVQPTAQNIFGFSIVSLALRKPWLWGYIRETSLVQAMEDAKRGRKLLRIGVANQPIGKRSNKH
jgi:hypothetical protein